jgi:hypothetical protein
MPIAGIKYCGAIFSRRILNCLLAPGFGPAVWINGLFHLCLLYMYGILSGLNTAANSFCINLCKLGPYVKYCRSIIYPNQYYN